MRLILPALSACKPLACKSSYQWRHTVTKSGKERTCSRQEILFTFPVHSFPPYLLLFPFSACMHTNATLLCTVFTDSESQMKPVLLKKFPKDSWQQSYRPKQLSISGHLPRHGSCSPVIFPISSFSLCSLVSSLNNNENNMHHVNHTRMKLLLYTTKRTEWQSKRLTNSLFLRKGLVKIFNNFILNKCTIPKCFALSMMHSS